MTNIYEGADHLLVHTDELQPQRHRHMASHVIIGMEAALEVTLDQQQLSCRGICLPAGVYHQVTTGSGPVLVFLFESTAAVSAEIGQVRILEEGICDEIVGRYSDLESSGDYGVFYCGVLKALAVSSAQEKKIDRRILSAMDACNSDCWEQTVCQQMADRSGLSQSRFSHLFRQETGMTFAAYRVRKKLLQAYREAMAGVSLTEAAWTAGFAGSSHFADVSRRVFGLSAGTILRNYRFRKVK